jgi:hypothetical protein
MLYVVFRSCDFPDGGGRRAGGCMIAADGGGSHIKQDSCMSVNRTVRLRRNLMTVAVRDL